MKVFNKRNFRLFAVAMCTFVVFSAVSCSEKDNDGDDSPATSGVFDGSSIVGKWQLVSIMTDFTDRNDGTHTVTETIEESDEAYRQFGANGTVKMIFQSGGSLNGTYTYNEETHALAQTIMDDLEQGTVTTLTAERLVYYAVYENTSHSTLVDTMKYVRVQ